MGALLLLTSSASAQEDDAARQRALDLFMEAEEAYEAGEVEHAVELLREARGLRREPVLLYNLARAYETLGRIDEALEAYEGYLEEEPDATDRGAIEARIAALRRQIEERERLERERAEAPEPVVVSPPREPSPAPWILLGVGGAAVGAAVGLGVASWQAREDAVDDPVHETASGSLDRAEDFALAANVLYAAGGAVALAGLVWGIVDVATLGPSGDAVSLRIGPGTATLRGRF